ncbi:Aste57867_21578 [Aphanomyces stellatus]|uniref:Aste57867_21578 protein n=1 Tax=Aphanomyces stellatus TaxID=120398 RepID=A0A485LJ96_9STRA|nr:hypothetical protein As57867_021509 [Aphanomyces stellatus]VFT98248.1 Aste57867_21578 [Aphanomyces stellatus]
MAPPCRVKRTKREHLVDPALPSDLLVRIAFFICAAQDAFNYVRAFHGTSLLGDLTHLVPLAATHAADDIWPSLRLRHASDASNVHIHALLRLYKDVELCGDMFDLTWLASAVSNSVVLYVHTFPSCASQLSTSIDDWYTQLATMRLFGLVWPLDLRHLDTLTFQVAAFLAPVLEFLPTSSITTLLLAIGTDDDELLPPPFMPPISVAMQEPLLEWMETHAVHRLLFQWSDLEAHPTTHARLVRALAASTSIRDLAIGDVSLMTLFRRHGFVLPQSLARLTLHMVACEAHAIKWLCTQLCDANVVELSLEEVRMARPADWKLLFALVPHTTVARLTLFDCNLTDRHVMALANVVSQSKLTHVNLEANPKLTARAVRQLHHARPSLDISGLDGGINTAQSW